MESNQVDDLIIVGKRESDPEIFREILIVMNINNIPVSEAKLRQLFSETYDELKRTENLVPFQRSLYKYFYLSKYMKNILEEMLEKEYIMKICITQEERIGDKIEYFNKEDLYFPRKKFDEI